MDPLTNLRLLSHERFRKILLTISIVGNLGLLCYFKYASFLLTALGPVLRTLVDVLRVAIGIVFTLTGLCFILAFLIAFGILAGALSPPDWNLFSDWYLSTPNIPLNAIRNSFPTWIIVLSFFTLIIPAMFAILLGSSIIARRIVFSATVGWSLFVIFFLSAGLISFSLPQFIFGFKEEGEFKEEQIFQVAGKTPVLQIHETGMDDYDVTSLYLRGYDGKDIKVIKRFQSQGSSRKVAAENARMVEYVVAQNDSILAFDSNITFKKDARFRAQRIDVDVLIPFGQSVVVESGLWRIIDNQEQFRFTHHNETRTIKIGPEGWECTTCLPSESDAPLSLNDQFGLSDFNSIDLKGLFDARIERGDTYAVEVSGPDKERGRYDVYVNGKTLVIDYDDNSKVFWKRDFMDDRKMKIRIIMPELQDLDVMGAGKLVFKGFDEDEVDIKLTGAVSGDGDISVDRLNIKLTGASTLELQGHGRFMDVDILGASGLRAYGYEVAHCVVEAHGASMARVYVSETLEISKGIASSVSHRGNAEVIRH